MTQFLENKLLNLQIGQDSSPSREVRLPSETGATFLRNIGAVLTAQITTQPGYCDCRLSPDYPGLLVRLLREQSVRL